MYETHKQIYTNAFLCRLETKNIFPGFLYKVNFKIILTEKIMALQHVVLRESRIC